MKNIPVWVFSTIAAGTACWFARAAMSLMIAKSYHPQAYYGSFGMVWMWVFASFAGTVFTARIICFFALKQHQKALSLGSAAVLALTALAHSASMSVDTGHKEIFWIGGVRHDVPWQYAPQTRRKNGVSSLFQIQVGTEELRPRYSSGGAGYFTLTKSIAPENGVAKALLDQCKQEDYGITCRSLRNGFLYAIHGRSKNLPQNTARLLKPAQELLDSFIVSP
ncbi:hypothetical protein N6L27_04615 [Leisingera sp. SS27]|uniref:hypothetical protein n=1 Tax=Leisingera sp. SS27 TaxID=2979462 RepID=UPI00232AC114|nr:hypothetical protein [Leisingera sp. SS27]MDC0657275.1 hypothetical protein [Leisingera sp. SS27]